MSGGTVGCGHVTAGWCSRFVECLDRGKWRWGGHAAPGEPQERVVGVLHEAAIECGRPACSWCYRQGERS